MKKELYNLKDLMEVLNNKSVLEIPDGCKVVAVFKNNNSDELLGFSIIPKYTLQKPKEILSIEEIFQKYERK